MRTEYSRLWSMNIDYRKTVLCIYCRSHMYCVKVTVSYTHLDVYKRQIQYRFDSGLRHSFKTLDKGVIMNE